MTAIFRYCMLVISVWFLMISCSGMGDQLVGGSGSETPNTFTLCISKGSVWGAGPGSVSVWIDSVTHVPSGSDIDIPDAVTDDQGYFSIRGLREGFYHIVCTDSTGTLGFLAESLWVSPTVQRDTFTLTLDTLGAINGEVKSQLRSSHRQVYLRGTPFTTFTDETGAFLLESIPQGRYVMATDTLIGLRPPKQIVPKDSPTLSIERVGVANQVTVGSNRTVTVNLTEEIIDTL